MGRVVLVTGVAADFGGRFARRIASDPDVQRVIGVDVTPPRSDLGTVSFVRADIRNPVIAKVVAGEDVDTVVHLSVQSAPDRAVSGGRSSSTSMKEHNVIGSMQLLAACQRASGLERLVVNSSAAVYGSSSRDPAMFTEDMGAKRLPRLGYARDVLEVESYVRGFVRRRPDVAVTMLRSADVVGPTVASPLTDYFRLPVVPTVLGYDARLQVLHEDDLLGALHHAMAGGAHGTFNVAGEGVMVLSQALRRLGRRTVAVPRSALSAAAQISRRTGGKRLQTELTGFLTFGRGLDVSRMHAVLGFSPEHTTATAFADFGRTLAAGMLPPTARPVPAPVGGDHA